MPTVNPSLDDIYDRMSDTTQTPKTHPATASLFTDWSLEAGDVVTISQGNKSYDIPVYQNKVQWVGAPKVMIESTGNKEREPIAKASRRSSGGGGVANTQEELKGLKDFTLLDLLPSVCSIHEDFINLSGSVLAIKESVVAVDASVFYLRTSVASINANIVNIDASLVSINGNITALGASVSNLTASMVSVEGQLTADAIAAKIATITDLGTQGVNVGANLDVVGEADFHNGIDMNSTHITGADYISTAFLRSSGSIIANEMSAGEYMLEDVALSSALVGGISAETSGSVTTLFFTAATGSTVSVSFSKPGSISVDHVEAGAVTSPAYDSSDQKWYSYSYVRVYGSNGQQIYANSIKVDVTSVYNYVVDRVTATANAGYRIDSATGIVYAKATAYAKVNGSTVDTDTDETEIHA